MTRSNSHLINQLFLFAATVLSALILLALANSPARPENSGSIGDAMTFGFLLGALVATPVGLAIIWYLIGR